MFFPSEDASSLAIRLNRLGKAFRSALDRLKER
jgi:hypothetical protein